MQLVIQKCTGQKNCHCKCPQNANVAETRKEEIDSEYEVEDINFVLMTTQNLGKYFVDEMIAKAVIDTVCTKTIAGELWLQNYMNNLNTSINQM